MKIYFAATSDQFLKPIITVLQASGVECVVDKVFNRKNSMGSDIIWCEWGDNNAILVQEFVTPAKKILRVHRYEAYTNIWDTMCPEEFDAIIFVSEHIKWEAEAQLGATIPNAVIIPNVLEASRFDIAKDKEPNNKIAYAGFLCRKKGFGEMLVLAESLPDYEFHVAGTFQDNDYFNFIHEDKPDNVFLVPWQKDLNEFYADKTYVLGTALSESAHLTVMEGMLAGLVPIQRNWKSSNTIYPETNIWKSVSDVKKILKAKVDWEANRQWIMDRFNPQTVMEAIAVVINTPKRVMEKTILLPYHYPETLTVAIVQSRDKYLPELVHTLQLQDRIVQDFEVKILRNFDKDMTIGQAYNKLADECTTDWIIYIGDDDIISPNYIDSIFLEYYRMQYKYKKDVGLITGCLIWEDGDSNRIAPTTHFPTGVWRTEFVQQHRFDETLVRQVDTEFVDRINHKAEGVVLQFPWVMGYYYRQHKGNISGNKLKEGAIMHQEPVGDSGAPGK